MARRILARSKQLGFTLVELLIVVAIIGVLSTIGVPTFKRMVQKAKKSEAKVSLGGLYTSEMAFFSEYGGYGNHLKGVGFEYEGQTALYTVGFPASNCKSAAAIKPIATSTIGLQITSTYGAYYTGFDAAAVNGAGTVVGRVGGDKCLVGADEDNGGYFIATASACIASGCSTAAHGSGTVTVVSNAGDAKYGNIDVVTAENTNIKQDSWAIDRTRRLVNVTDGVQ